MVSVINPQDAPATAAAGRTAGGRALRKRDESLQGGCYEQPPYFSPRRLFSSFPFFNFLAKKG